MRVALIQVLFAPSSRAATIQHLMAVVDRAAATTPAPDVLLLPGGCDNGGEIAQDRIETGRRQVQPPLVTMNFVAMAQVV